MEDEEMEENNGKVSWIVGKGLTLGKRVLVTGLVVSTAPVLLPSLLIFSAIGFACTVPCGIFLASYACTEKLMSKLLPITPPPHLLLEYGTKDGGGGVAASPDIEEELKDTKESMEVRFELERESRDGLVENRGENVEVNGFEEDSGEYMDEEEGKETEARIKGERQEKEEVPDVAEAGVTIVIEGEDMGGSDDFREMDAPFDEVKSVVVELREGQDNAENEELRRETIGLIEKMRKEGDVEGEVTAEDKQSADVVGETGLEQKENGDKAIEAESLEALKPEKKELIANIGGLSEQKGVDTRIEQEQKPEAGKGKAATLSNEQDHDVVIRNDTKQEKKLDGEDGISSSNPANLQETGTDHKEKKTNKRKKKKPSKSKPQTEHKIPEENEHSSSSEHATASSPRISAEGNNDMASVEETPYSEEKLWGQINAMRKIVGYTASPQASCVEEVKALYIFTGVEPPTTLNDPCDLAEVNHKLRFLMTIVGVK